MGDNKRWDVNIGGKIIKKGIALNILLMINHTICVRNGSTLINAWYRANFYNPIPKFSRLSSMLWIQFGYDKQNTRLKSINLKSKLSILNPVLLISCELHVPKSFEQQYQNSSQLLLKLLFMSIYKRCYLKYYKHVVYNMYIIHVLYVVQITTLHVIMYNITCYHVVFMLVTCTPQAISVISHVIIIVTCLSMLCLSLSSVAFLILSRMMALNPTSASLSKAKELLTVAPV